MPGPTSTAELNQKQYADRVGVTPSRISRATKKGGVVQGKYVPARDAVTDEAGNLLGYQMPVERNVSPENASAKSAQKAAGISSGEERNRHGIASRENGRARENPSSRNRTTGQSPNGGRSEGGSGLEQALEKAGETAGAQAARSPGILRGLLRLGGSALGAILAAELVGRQAGPVLIGSVVGFGITEYAVRTEQTRPQEPTLQIPSKGLRRPLRHGLLPGMSALRHGLLPGMSQDGRGQEQMRGQAFVKTTPLARGRPVET
jgi:hypothetical protein